MFEKIQLQIRQLTNEADFKIRDITIKKNLEIIEKGLTRIPLTTKEADIIVFLTGRNKILNKFDQSLDDKHTYNNDQITIPILN